MSNTYVLCSNSIQYLLSLFTAIIGKAIVWYQAILPLYLNINAII